jgi:hypothetical protein
MSKRVEKKQNPLLLSPSLFRPAAHLPFSSSFSSFPRGPSLFPPILFRYSPADPAARSPLSAHKGAHRPTSLLFLPPADRSGPLVGGVPYLPPAPFLLAASHRRTSAPLPLSRASSMPHWSRVSAPHSLGRRPRHFLSRKRPRTKAFTRP